MKIEKLDNKINQVLSGWDSPKLKSRQTIWQAVKDEVQKENALIVPISKWKLYVAASVVAIAISFGIFYTSQVEVVSTTQATNFNLPDGSTVNLNLNSRASYNSVSWLFNRSVALSGEAFFTVKRGEKFSVLTEGGTITVLGTSFNVLSRVNKFKVECFTGKVAVNNGTNSSIITKGEVVTQSEDKEALVKESILHNKLSPNWVTGEYSYRNERLVTVLNDISNHFGIDIKASNKINKLSFTGVWNKEMTLDEVLKIICLPFNLEAKTNDNRQFKIDHKTD